MDNVAATSCDHTDFSAAPFSNNVTRSFLIPGAKRLPAQFGLTETVGSLPAAPGPGLGRGGAQEAGRVPGQVTSAPRSSAVAQIATAAPGPQRLARDRRRSATSPRWTSSWASFGTAPRWRRSASCRQRHATMAPGAFNALAERALDRLPALPPPAAGAEPDWSSHISGNACNRVPAGAYPSQQTAQHDHTRRGTSAMDEREFDDFYNALVRRGSPARSTR